MKMTYKIVRYYTAMNKPNEVIEEGLTLEQAREHCNNPETRKSGEYFDGYVEE